MKKTILYLLMAGGTAFLTNETHLFVYNQGVNYYLSWVVAVTLEGFCLVAATYRDWYARSIVIAFVLLALFASSFNKIDPLLTDQKISPIHLSQMQAADEKIQTLESEVSHYKNIGWNKNYKLSSQALKTARAEKTALLNKIETAPKKTADALVMQGRIGGILFLRLFLLISNIFCASKLGAHESGREKQPGPVCPAGLQTHLKKTEPAQTRLKPIQAVQTEFETVSNDLKEVENPSNHVKLSEQAVKLMKYIDNSGGSIRRGNLLASRKFEGAAAYDAAIEELSNAGVMTQITNGKKSNTVYQL